METSSGLTYRKLHRFTLKLSKDDPEELRKEVKRLSDLVRDQAIEQDVASGRVLPRDRELFTRRAGPDATLEDWQRFRDGTPKPTVFMGQQVAARNVRPSEDDPAAEVAERVKETMAKDPRLTYSAAMVAVLRADPSLAERYRHAPGTQE